MRFGCEFLDFDPVPYLGTKESRRVDRAAQMGFAAAADALADAGDVGVDPARAGVIAGTGIGGLITLEDQVKTYIEKGPDRVSPFFVPMMMANATAGIIAIHLGWTGPNLCISTACAASANAIGEATRLIREGLADVVMAGGTECAITPPAVAAFARMGALSKRNDEPELASRPFDADRDGFVMGEGAGMVVLERADRAEARGAHIYGEIAGYGTNSDAFHITAPSQGGAGAAACMQLALDDAGLTVDRHRPRERARHVHRAQRLSRSRSDPQGLRRRYSPGDLDQGRHRPPHRCCRRGRGDRVRCRPHGSVSSRRPRTTTGSATTWSRSTSCTASPDRSRPAPAISNSFGFGGHNAVAGVGPRALMLLDGKRILVSGVLNDASIGFGVAKLAQEQGAEVILTSFGRVMSLTKRTARKLPSEPEIVELDVTNSEDLAALAGRVGGKIDGVLHAIAFAPESCLGGGFLDAPWEDVAVAFQVSAYSLAALARAALPLMSRGRIDRRARLRQPDPGVAGLRLDGRGEVRVRSHRALPRPRARAARHPCEPRVGRTDPHARGAQHPGLRAVRSGVGRACAARLGHPRQPSRCAGGGGVALGLVPRDVGRDAARRRRLPRRRRVTALRTVARVETPTREGDESGPRDARMALSLPLNGEGWHSAMGSRP